MPLFTLWFGAAMVSLGFFEFAASGLSSAISLVPTVLGLPMAVLGFTALPKGRMGRPALAGCAALAMIGFLTSVTALADLWAVYNGKPVDNAMFPIIRSVVSVLFLGYMAAALAALSGARTRAQR